MNVIIQSARIIDSKSPHHGKVRDIEIANGKIKKIATKIPVGRKEVIKLPGLHVSPGWFDIRADFCDPGMEHQEDIESGLKAAAAGGFTAVSLMPSTTPPVDSRPGIEYVLKRASGNLVDVYPQGAITKALEGKELAEMYDMQQAGAIGFTDDTHALSDASILSKGLQYAKGFDGILSTFPNNTALASSGQINEGSASVSTGLKGIPAVAEETQLARDLALLEYTGGRLHIHAVSTARSVDLVRQAKRKKLNVTCDVCAINLLLDEREVLTFDTNFKVMPPLRTTKDIKALHKGIADDTIDAIASDHRPQDIESKKLEFDHADFGTIGLETAFATANTNAENYSSMEAVIEKLTHGPRSAMALPENTIKEKTLANLTLFQPTKVVKVTGEQSHSKSENSPLYGRELKGIVVGVINHDELRLNKA